MGRVAIATCGNTQLFFGVYEERNMIDAGVVLLKKSLKNIRMGRMDVVGE